jgi:hypothetical protein
VIFSLIPFRSICPLFLQGGFRNPPIYAAIENSTGAITIYRRNTKPALGPVATAWTTLIRVGGGHDQGR